MKEKKKIVSKALKKVAAKRRKDIKFIKSKDKKDFKVNINPRKKKLYKVIFKIRVSSHWCSQNDILKEGGGEVYSSGTPFFSITKIGKLKPKKKK